MDKRDIGRAVAKRTGLTARKAEAVLDLLVDSIIEGVARDGEVKMTGLGIEADPLCDLIGMTDPHVPDSRPFVLAFALLCHDQTPSLCPMSSGGQSIPHRHGVFCISPLIPHAP